MADNLDQLYGADWFENINKTIQLLEKQEGAIKSTNDAMRSLVSDLKGAKGLDDLANGQSKVATTTQQAVAGFDDFNAAIKQAEALKAQYNGSTKEMVAITLTSAKATKTLAEAAKIQVQAQKEAEKQTRSSTEAAKEFAAAQKAAINAVDPTSLKALSDRLEGLRQGYNKLTEAERKNEEIGGVLLKRIKELDAQLKTTDASMGKFQRNVGNYSSATNGLRGSMQQLTRELPSISNGFATFASAIGNNIAPAQDAIRAFREEQAKLRAEGKPTVSLFSALSGAILNWQTGLLLAVTALTVYGKQIGEFITGTKKATAANRDFEESIDDINTALEEGSARLDRVTKLRLAQAKARGASDKELAEIERQGYEERLTDQEAFINESIANEAYYLDLLNRVRGGIKLESGGKRLTEDDINKKLAEARAQTNKLQQQRDSIKTDRDLAGFGSEASLNNKDAKEAERERKRRAAEAKRLAEEARREAEREAEEARRRYYTDLEARAERESLIKKQIADDESKSLDERLSAHDVYNMAVLQAMMYRAAKEGLTEEQIKLETEKIVQAAAKRRLEIVKSEVEEEERIRKNLAGITTGGKTQSRSEYESERLKNAEEWTNKSIEFAYALGNINSAIAAKRIKEIDEEISAINRKRDAEIEGIEKSGLSATEKERKIAEVKAKAASKEADLMNERNRRARRAAELEKAINIVSIIGATALAVAKQLQVPGAGIGLAVLAGAVGAAQLAAAIAAPIPAFKDGTDNSPEGLARVSEEGAEMYVTKDGKIGLTPDKETITYLQRGTKIIPHQQTMEIMKHMAIGVPELRARQDRSGELLNELQESREVLKSIRDKRFPTSHAQPAWWSAYYAQKTK